MNVLMFNLLKKTMATINFDIEYSDNNDFKEKIKNRKMFSKVRLRKMRT